jgi:hypothetical protein
MGIRETVEGKKVARRYGKLLLVISATLSLRVRPDGFQEMHERDVVLTASWDHQWAPDERFLRVEQPVNVEFKNAWMFTCLPQNVPGTSV